MAPSYTRVLWSHYQGSAVFPISSPGPPAGTSWVIRDVTATNWPSSNHGSGVNPLDFTLNSIPVFATPRLLTVAGVSYRWRDMRLAMAVGDVLQANSTDVYWSFVITGYQLGA